MLKVVLYLIPCLSLLYLLPFLDRTNIGNTKTEGHQEDLNMSNSQATQPQLSDSLVLTMYLSTTTL